YGSSAAFRFEVPIRACGRRCRNFKSAALARGRNEPLYQGSTHCLPSRPPESNERGEMACSTTPPCGPASCWLGVAPRRDYARCGRQQSGLIREEHMTRRLTRRTLLKNTALGSAAVIATPYVRGAYAAGRLTLGCWDHWVPGANNTLTKLCNEWGEKNKVEVHIDYITSQGEKDKLTAAAEAQAGTGHDIMPH